MSPNDYTKLKDLIKYAFLVAYERDANVIIDDTVYATTGIEEIAQLDSSLQDLMGSDWNDWHQPYYDPLWLDEHIDSKLKEIIK